MFSLDEYTVSRLNILYADQAINEKGIITDFKINISDLCYLDEKDNKKNFINGKPVFLFYKNKNK